MVELSTRINCFFSVYRPSKLTSDVRMVVSFFSALKKRATIPPKPQSVSNERTAKGKASRFLAAFVESLAGSLMLKGLISLLTGKVSVGTGMGCQAKADRVEKNSNTKKQTLI